MSTLYLRLILKCLSNRPMIIEITMTTAQSLASENTRPSKESALKISQEIRKSQLNNTPMFRVMRVGEKGERVFSGQKRR